LHLVGILFPHIIDYARSKPHQISILLIYSPQKSVDWFKSYLGLDGGHGHEAINLSFSY
jgi:hypothetical protein